MKNKISKQIKIKSIFGLLMASTMFVVSCKKAVILPEEIPNESSNETSISKSLNQTSGEDLFRSIFYLDGSITSKIPSIAHLDMNNQGISSSQLKAYREGQTKMISRIKDKSPNFFNDFKAKIESNNPVIIRELLKNSKELFYEVAEDILSENGLVLEHEMNNYMSDSDIDVPDKMVAVVIVILFVVTVAVVITVDSSTMPKPQDEILAVFEASNSGNNILLDVLSAEVASLSIP